MRSTGGWKRGAAAVLAGVLAAGGCGGEAPGASSAEHPTEPERTEATRAVVAAPSQAEWEALEARIHAEADSVDRALRRVSTLSRQEQAGLRQDVNDPQTARARALGVRAGNAYEDAAARGRLVRLADSTEYWVVRELDFSVPYTTPGAEAMLAELGRRFHAALDTLGVPRYRMDVTSVLRTPAKQAALRRTNPNAAAGVSAHEFGTTLDVAYRSFIPPAGEAAGTHPAHAAPAAALRDSLLAETAHQRSAELQAVLGRVLLEMRREGKLMVMMERQQTVYHMTVARRFPGAQRVPPVTGTGTVQPPRAEEPVSAER
jgi:hypothetical protein